MGTSANGGGGTAVAPYQSEPTIGVMGNAVVQTTETASSAVAAQAKANVEARYLMALHRPRSWMTVRSRLLEACERPGFAEMALYALPRWDARLRREVNITGPSIRFAEEAARHMGNLLIEPVVVLDDADKRVITVWVTDLESNISWPSPVVVQKTVERAKPKQGQTVLRSRTNSEGHMVYVVAATEDDLANKQASMISKAARNGILRMLPGDVLEEAVERVHETLANADAADPKKAVKKVCDAFYRLGVEPGQLETYLGHKVDVINPAELQELRGIHAAIKDGQTTWAQVMEGQAKPAGETQGAAATTTTRGTEGLRAKVSQKAQPAAPTKPVEQMTDEELLALDEQRAAGETAGG